MYLIPVGIFAAHDLSQFTDQFVEAPSLAGFMGNILGGSLVAAVYYLVYLRHDTKPANKP
jgi:formate/nitrite transporter FocA (FNT family)